MIPKGETGGYAFQLATYMQWCTTGIHPRPLLFNIFMNDLSYVIKKCTLSTYADDTQIFYADNQLSKVEETINNDLISADIWFARNGMKRNSSKYQAMVLGKHKGTDEPVFKCEESQLPISNTMELLGVTIDDKLNFEKHIAKICRKVSQQVAVLKRMQKMLSFETRRDLYKAFILPHFNYCSETWHFCNKKSSDKLELVNKRALRFVFRDKSSPYEELCKRIGLSSLREQRLAKILSTVFKILASDAGPKSLRDLITVRCSTYNLRGTTILDLPKVKSTTFGLRSWRYAASKLWNALPDESRKIQTFTTFKNYLKTLDLTGL